MYNTSGRIIAFETFHLRSRAEMDALKLFFLFAARRGSDTNAANISYDKTEEYTGIELTCSRKPLPFELGVLS